jgi:hypothetical protein
MKNIALFVAVLLMCGLALGQGNEYWHKKDYKQWNERECRKLLEDSPWARRHVISQVFITPLQQNDTDTDDAQRRGREANPQLIYQVQFRSAQPLRHAMVRLQQINQKYDKMAAEQQQQFDQGAEKFLSSKFDDSVVIYVTITSNVQLDDREIARHWQNQTTETLKNFIFLINGKGEKVPLRSYTVTNAGRAFQLVFPRQHNERPVATAQDKTLKLEFVHPRVRASNEQRVLIEFRVDKMLMQGEPVF